MSVILTRVGSVILSVLLTRVGSVILFVLLTRIGSVILSVLLTRVGSVILSVILGLDQTSSAAGRRDHQLQQGLHLAGAAGRSRMERSQARR